MCVRRSLRGACAFRQPMTRAPVRLRSRKRSATPPPSSDECVLVSLRTTMLYFQPDPRAYGWTMPTFRAPCCVQLGCERACSEVENDGGLGAIVSTILSRNKHTLEQLQAHVLYKEAHERTRYAALPVISTSTCSACRPGAQHRRGGLRLSPRKPAASRATPPSETTSRSRACNSFWRCASIIRAGLDDVMVNATCVTRMLHRHWQS